MRRRTMLGAMAAAVVGSGTGVPAHARPQHELAPMGADFMWGVAASGFQSEGSAPDSNWTRYIAERHYDEYFDSVDFYHRYPSDIALARGLGVNTFRIGIEWARVQPEPGRWDEAGFQFYDRVIAEILAAGMRPMLTLDHWVYPGWAAERGGWKHPQMVDDWLTNMRAVVDRYAKHDPLWVTINEPVAYIVHEMTHTGIDGPTIEERFAQAHNDIYDYIHQVHPGAMVTSNVGYVSGAETEVNGPMVGRISDRLDYIGVDYYYGVAVAPISRTARSAAGTDVVQMWELPLQAEGIYYALRHYARLFPDRPLFVVENGMPTENGKPRPDGYARADYLRDVVYWLQRAVADQIHVIGYNYWSLTDNYEWGSYTPCFGLYTVDVSLDSPLERVPTDAVAAYREIIANRGVPANYLPTRPPVSCSQVDPPSSCDEPVELPGSHGSAVR